MFAFESRERLRRTLIGKTVTFRVEYKVDSINREFGVVFTESGENVSLSQVRAGMCKVKSGGSDRASNVEELEAAEQAAQAEGIGMWSKDPSVLAAANRPPVQAISGETLLSTLKMKPTPAVVEFVLNGGTVKLMLTGDGMVHGQIITASIGGIKVPSMGRKGAKNEDGTEQGPEPFATEAKNFTELSLMHRDVRVILESLDRRDNFIVSILPADVNDASFVNVGEALCRHGLAQVHESSAAALICGAMKLRAAEKAAKDQKLRLWHNYVPPVSTLNAVDLKNFTAKVIEVVSGDCVSVLPISGSDNAERRINLSSIRAPRFSHSRDENAQHEPWAVESRSFLISRLIGQTVEVSMDYTRKIGDGANERLLQFATVKLQSKKGGEALNVSEMLLIRGLATAIRHRGEEERASNYDELIVAEKKGIESKKGVHSKNRDAPIHRHNDFSMNAHKAKTFLPFLQRAGKCTGLVEYVATGHKLRVSIPKEGAVIAFCLAGVRCPQRDEPYADQALAFTRAKVLQREVEIEVDSVDKNGTFLGSLTLNHGHFNLGEELLRLGLGSLHPAFPVDRVQGGRALAEIEAAAKETKAGLWKDWTPPVVQVTEEEDSEASMSSELVEVGVTEVLGGGRFFVQKLAGSKVSFVTDKLAELYDNEDTNRAADGVFEPKVGDMVAAKFTRDDKWSRAIVTGKRVGDKPVPVFYCDFGNEESLDFNRLRPLRDSSITAGAIPPMANLCAFSGLKVPSVDSEYGFQAATFIGQTIANNAFFARINARERYPTTKPWDEESPVTFALALFQEKDSTESVAVDILRAGFARVDARACRRLPSDFVQSLRDAQEFARRSRSGMWEYGDVDSDED